MPAARLRLVGPPQLEAPADSSHRAPLSGVIELARPFEEGIPPRPELLTLLDWHTRPGDVRNIRNARVRALAAARAARLRLLDIGRRLMLVLAALLGDALRARKRLRLRLGVRLNPHLPPRLHLRSDATPNRRGAHAQPGLDVRLGGNASAGRHARRGVFAPGRRPGRHRVPAAPPAIVLRRLFVATGAAAVAVIAAATSIPVVPAAVLVAARAIPHAATVRVGQRAGAMEVSVLQVRSMTTAVTVAAASLGRARGRLAAEQKAHQEARIHLVDMSRQMYVGAVPGAPIGALGEFGITSEQEFARMVAQLVAVERSAAARVEAAEALVRRADIVLASRKADLKTETARLEALRKAEQARAKAAAARRSAGLPSSNARFGGRLLRPVNAPMSSTFGYRYDPYYHVGQLHAGIDLAASSGTPIRAAADGWVQRAGYNGGYGNYTCLSHGVVAQGRLSTCYAHQSRILVHSGQHVSRGQVIGLVGTTGASTGPHLHFEVRLGGRPVDPLPWL